MSKTESFVTAVLYADGHELRFFAPLKDKVALAATLVTWVSVKLELIASSAKKPSSENEWYHKAQEYYNTEHQLILEKGLAIEKYNLLKEHYLDYDNSMQLRNLMLQAWGLGDE